MMRAMTEEPRFADRLAAVAALTLCSPTAEAVEIVGVAAGRKLNADAARQDFYDVFCIPQSGRYVPPYVHVLRRAQQQGEYWHFPPPRHDGGDEFLPWYQMAGFDPQRLDVSPLLRGPLRPLDHIGFILAYLAGLAAAWETDPAAREVAAGFVTEILGHWADLYVDLLGQGQGDYVPLVAEALAEALADVRAVFALPVVERRRNVAKGHVWEGTGNPLRTGDGGFTGIGAAARDETVPQTGEPAAARQGLPSCRDIKGTPHGGAE